MKGFHCFAGCCLKDWNGLRKDELIMSQNHRAIKQAFHHCESIWKENFELLAKFI